VRYLLLDRITLLAPPERATGQKCVSLADDIFADHFPGHPVLPGALIIEALAMLGGVLLEQTVKQRGLSERHALLTMVDRAKFRRLVRPGDRLELEALTLTCRDEGGQIRGSARVDGALAAEAELGFAFAEVTDPVLLARRAEYLKVWLQGEV
jgi:3-hydroxymyristoyl/3-hydroxydecanoyl-(acyl carrier protein) dehydratase